MRWGSRPPSRAVRPSVGVRRCRRTGWCITAVLLAPPTVAAVPVVELSSERGAAIVGRPCSRGSGPEVSVRHAGGSRRGTYSVQGQAPTGIWEHLAGRAPRLIMSGALGTMMTMTVARSSPRCRTRRCWRRCWSGITYANEETGYTVARVATGRGGDDLLTVVGALLGAQPGESLRLTGPLGVASAVRPAVRGASTTPRCCPATIQGIRRYLGSGLVKGIGPVFAERIVDHFGVDTLRVIEEEPQRLIEVPGLGPKRTKMIAAAWEEQKAIKEVMVFLQGVGVSTSLAVRIYKKYGDASIAVVRERAVPAGRRRVGDRVQDRRHDRPGGRHPARQPASGSRPGLQYTLSRGHRQRPLLPARSRT